MTEVIKALKKSEHQEQSAYFDWVRIMRNSDSRFENIFAIPNGAKLPFTTKIDKKGKKVRICPQAKWLKDEGLEPGVPDVFVAVPMVSGWSHFHGMFIEFKIAPNAMTDEQRKWKQRLIKHTFSYALVWSWEEASKYTLTYFNLE